MVRPLKTWRPLWVAALLGAVTLAVFWPVWHSEFIRFDDNIYVTRNSHIQSGLTWEGVKWALGTGFCSYWHPLTWMSHMLDVQLFGLRPGWHHLVNLLYHIANTILLFFLLRRMTGALWRSALVAALFALHPLHVESVAWVAERKDVLSTFFLMLTLLAYVRYAECQLRSPKPEVHSPQETHHASRITHHLPGLWYVLALIAYALGLMSKPMLVALPFLLLLLDYWPLGRIAEDGAAIPRLKKLLFEKLPFLVLALACGVVTFLVQNQANNVLWLPFGSRLANAVASYWKYLGKMVWPVNLAVFYPHPDARYPISTQWPSAVILLAALLLAGVSLWALLLRKRQPWLAVGWFWYLGLLAPASGFIQSGNQAMADRYTYVPLIGIFIALTWTVSDFFSRRTASRTTLAGAALLLVAVCALMTRRQVSFWHDNFSLFQHALRVTQNNAVAHFHVGTGLGEQGEFDQARAHFEAAIEADPKYVPARQSLGIWFEGFGQYEKAAEQYRAALRLAPAMDAAHTRLGAALWALGQQEEALAEYAKAVRLNPNSVEARYRLGLARLARGELAEASANLAETARLQPASAEVLAALGRVRLAQGQPKEAIANFGQAVKLKPDSAGALNELAWVLATYPLAEVRDGAEAVRLAERACLLDGKSARFCGTLDAAYAEAGRFADAIRAAEKARELALAAGQKDLAQAAETRLAGYREDRAFHQAVEASKR